MEALIEQSLLKQLASMPYIDHVKLQDPVFMKEQRDLAIETLKKEDCSATYAAYVKRIKTELRIISKYDALSSDMKDIWTVYLVKYFKEIRLYKTLSRSETDYLNLNLNLNAELNIHTFQAWIGKLSNNDLNIVADLISDL